MNQVVSIMFIEGTVSISLVVPDSILLNDYVIQLPALPGHVCAVWLLMCRDESPGAVVIFKSCGAAYSFIF